MLRIIDNPDGYQQQAVETAKTIFSERQLTEVEIKAAKDELEFEKNEKIRRKQESRKIEERVKKIGASLFNNLNLIQKETPTSEKTITIISLIFGGVFLLQFLKEFGLISFMLTNSSANWDFSMVLYFLTLIVIPTAILLFYKRKRVGWLLFTIFLTYSAVSAFGMFLLTINMQPTEFSIFDDFFPQTSPATYFLVVLLYGGTIWVISKESLRTVFSINKKKMVYTISLTVFIVALGLHWFF